MLMSNCESPTFCTRSNKYDTYVTSATPSPTAAPTTSAPTTSAPTTAAPTNAPTNAPTMCQPVSTSTADAGYSDAYRGWYDVQGCGQCNDYCRWVGNSGSGGNPETKLSHGSSWWSCRLAGGTAPYSSNGHFTNWSYPKCNSQGAA